MPVIELDIELQHVDTPHETLSFSFWFKHIVFGYKKTGLGVDESRRYHLQGIPENNWNKHNNNNNNNNNSEQNTPAHTHTFVHATT